MWISGKFIPDKTTTQFVTHVILKKHNIGNYVSFCCNYTSKQKKTVECQILTNHYAKSIEFLRSLFVDFHKYSL